MPWTGLWIYTVVHFPALPVTKAGQKPSEGLQKTKKSRGCLLRDRKIIMKCTFQASGFVFSSSGQPSAALISFSMDAIFLLVNLTSSPPLRVNVTP